jgi:hypothetical protein
MAVLVWSLDDDATAHDLPAEFVESRHELPNPGFKSGRGLHVAESDLQGQFHRPTFSK